MRVGQIQADVSDLADPRLSLKMGIMDILMKILTPSSQCGDTVPVFSSNM
jgi:hypothetical protein